ncbi:hypothetical protein EC912_10874 [Luteibacter rhizovicinus]|uniref:Uncharacterized protein n=1 Tax=Luteibacter rhizovicinus TaxID=242606 RepID=A0A4R3YJ58_9GAMM|nr:hypothetical protein [Luteibacter rhizovicinus]TCV92082.1 hypothetical protein EC912_10874 [Luteibacter rhizovicinus]
MSKHSSTIITTHDIPVACPLCKGERKVRLGDIHERITEHLSGMRGATDLLIDVPMIDAEEGSVAQTARLLRNLIDEVTELYRAMSLSVTRDTGVQLQ